ncbi:PREDICTED: uncharacterized protein LOC106103935 [Papilio polytes]|uniref:uncharacterized protein LOC106103935 n=1 Tax=Papilio polytes TaxID=76194 RepID=UPI000676277E|nr:PREDICTED: uncharacterized protein LOC106103935 [Papilio polytes]
MRFVRTILILSLGVTLAEETIKEEFNNLAKDIENYMNQYLPQLESRMFDTTDDDAMVLSYIIANATKDILMNSKTNDDDYVKNILNKMKTTEIPEVDFVTNDPTVEENKKMLAPKAIIADKYTEVIRKKTKKEIDSDTETSSFLQSTVKQISSNENTQRKDAPFSVPLYVMGRGSV